MNEQLKHRVIGAGVLVVLAVVLIPILLPGPPDDEPDRGPDGLGEQSPPARPSFSSSVVPVVPVERRTDDPNSKRDSGDRNVSADVRSRSALRVGDVATPIPAIGAGEASSTVAQRSPSPTPPTPVITATRTKATPPPSTLGGPQGWAVQVGSFSNPQNALGLRDRLKAQGFTAFVAYASAGGARVTRVLVGPVRQREAADSIRVRLRTTTDLRGILVQYPRAESPG